MSCKITRFSVIRIVFVLMGMVSIVYAMYVLDKPDLLYKVLLVCRVMLFSMIFVGFYFIKIKIDINTIIPLCFSVYTLIRSYIDGGSILNKTLTIMIWPLIYVLFYSHIRSVKPDDNRINIERKKTERILMIIMLTLTVCCIPLIQRHLSGNGRAGEVIFPVYFFLTIISIILLVFPNNKALWVLPFLMIILSTKRNGLLIIAGGFLAAQIAEYHLAGTLKEKWKKILILIVTLVIACIVFFMLVRYFDLDILERLSALSEDGGSSRNKIWVRVIDDYKDGSILQYIFGKGYQSVTKMMLTGRSILAHNDYLEILHDYGAIGLALCMVWILQIIIAFVKAWKKKISFLPSFTYTMCSMLLLSLFSYLLIQSYLMNYTAAYLGIAVSLMKNNNAVTGTD